MIIIYINRQIDRQKMTAKEPVGLMEPMMPSEAMGDLEDLTLDLVAKANQLAGKLNPLVAQSIGHVVRSMNCYYSNLIEGHDTHPRDIDRALADDYSTEPKKRNLQQEAVAHIDVQRMIDEGHAPGYDPLSSAYALWLHKEFCSRLPDDLLWVENKETGKRIKVIPGEWRKDEVLVGRHEPPLSDNLPDFLIRFDEAYGSATQRSRRAIATAAAHHRFLWIHPFIDGNGRVTRLMSHASLLKQGIGSPLWSVARGLARRVNEYKQFLMMADMPRQGDLDGRGTLSQKALVDFCRFFLEIGIDQVDYMSSLIQPDEFLRRLRIYTEDEISAGRLPKGSFQIFREVFLSGQMERGKAPEVTGYRERAARDVIAQLVQSSFLISETPKAPVRLAFPYKMVERVFPALYPVGM
jgi:Fic family protein